MDRFPSPLQRWIAVAVKVKVKRVAGNGMELHPIPSHPILSCCHRARTRTKTELLPENKKRSFPRAASTRTCSRSCRSIVGGNLYSSSCVRYALDRAPQGHKVLDPLRGACEGVSVLTVS
jgi:hypothetical protein